MSQLLSPTIVAPLLAGLLMLGNTPAWLHVGMVSTCVPVAESPSDDHGGCGHCDAHHTSSRSVDRPGDSCDDEHGSDDCSTCFLAATGLLAAPQMAVSLPATHLVVFLNAPDGLSGWVGEPIEPRSRGPPVV